MYLTLHPEIKNFFPSHKNPFSQIMQLKGEIFRELEGRCTQRITLGEKKYFIKQHFGIGWKEVFKNLIQLRLPVTSAKNEWRAIQYLNRLQIPTLEIVGYGHAGINPGYQKSFIMTRELLKFITLEDLGKQWGTHPPSFRFKQQLIKEIARIARTLHDNGINHRDFYLCHFLLDLIKYPNTVKLYLIDLHRAQIRRRTPSRWVIKDLAGLYFSSKNMGLTQRDIYRFIKWYRGQSLHVVLKNEIAFWLKVENRGAKLYKDENN